MSLEEEQLVTVFSTSNRAIFLIAKSILEGSGIEYFTKHEYLEALAYGAGTQDILVSEKNAKAARKLLENIREDNPEYYSDRKQKENFSGFKKYTSVLLLLIVLTGIISFIVMVLSKYF